MRLALLLVLAFWTAGAFSWSDHASLLWPLVRSEPDLMTSRVPAEPLDAFVRAEFQGVVAVLASVEASAVDRRGLAPPTPHALRLQSRPSKWREAGGSDDDLMAQFLAAIRVNPTLSYALYRQLTVDDMPAPSPTLRWTDLSFLPTGDAHENARYRPLAPGDLVSPAQVIASASDEPDFGMDVGLFDDNGTDFGLGYGFGAQPFGNPNLAYSSQAPFHMGFYHLDAITEFAQPGLLKTFPRWRIELYGELAKLAFDTGHPYWGWRFMGWALHYIGDLTQPYHAVPLPGVSTPEALWLVVTGGVGDAVQRVSNRHGVLESYQYQRVATLLDGRRWSAELLQGLVGDPHDQILAYDDITDSLTAASVAAAPALDAALERWVPYRYVSDPEFEWVDSGLETHIVDLVNEASGAAATNGLDAIILEQLQRFSFYARGWLNAGRQQLAARP